MKAKLKIIPFIILPALLISFSSCSLFNTSEEKTLNIYNLDIAEDNADKSSFLVGTIKARFNKDQGYVPYLSLKQYASLFTPHFDEDVSSKISKKGSLVSWTVTKASSLVFITEIDYSNKIVLTAGGLDSAFIPGDNPVDTGSLYYGNKTDYDTKLLSFTYYSKYSFKNIELNSFSFGGDVYLPLSFYDLTYSFDSSLYFHYNYAGIYSSSSADNFFLKQFTDNKKTLTVSTEGKNYKQDSEMPQYLREHNVNMFMYLLDNFYGLKEYKKIDSAESYCKSIGTYDKLLSGNDKERVQAYADTLSMLDDDHTGLVAASDMWNETTFDPRYYGENSAKRTSLRQQLTELRSSKLSNDYAKNYGTVYSSDGKTAMFLFDSFIYGSTEQCFDNRGRVKADAYKYDTFFCLIDFFKSVSSKGGVKNVVLDMSTNGGGVLGVLMKLLALISRDNTGYLSYKQGASNMVAIANTKIDINGDMLFNTADCFGDDFNIYLLTSDCSFSCGNALPCYAQIAGSAKVIGKKSGGGECAVAAHLLPNGEYVYHSSTIHIGYFDEATNEFTGFEDGAQPDIVVDSYQDFYNVNKLNTLISNS